MELTVIRAMIPRLGRPAIGIDEVDLYPTGWSKSFLSWLKTVLVQCPYEGPNFTVNGITLGNQLKSLIETSYLLNDMEVQSLIGGLKSIVHEQAMWRGAGEHEMATEVVNKLLDKAQGIRELWSIDIVDILAGWLAQLELDWLPTKY
jgi:hypothetical protein